MKSKNEDSEPIQVSLSRDEALVLFEFLARHFNDEQELKARFEGERQALNGLQGRLEVTLAELFADDYDDLVRDARQRLVDQFGSFGGL